MLEQITVLIVDDHSVVRQGVRAFLEAQPDVSVLGEAEAGAEGVRLAQELVLSEKTVKGHVSNIFSKLHMADRTQAAVFAWQQGLMEHNY